MFAAANAAQRSSGQRRAMRERIAGMTDGLHDGLAQLGAETADVDVDDVGARVEGAAPDLLEQLGARADLAFLEREVLEQQELPRRERDGPLPGVGGAAVRVEREAARAQQAVGGLGSRLAQPRPHASDELGERERLGEVVGGPDLQAADLGVDVAQRGEHQHALLRPGLDGPAQHAHAADAGHHQVEHDEVVAAGASELQATGAVRGAVDRQPVGGKGAGDEVGDLRLIIDDKYSWHGARSSSAGPSGAISDKLRNEGARTRKLPAQGTKKAAEPVLRTGSAARWRRVVGTSWRMRPPRGRFMTAL